MRKAIFVKFIQVILAALVLSSAIFYIAASSALLKNSRTDMTYTLRAIDSVLDYSGDLEGEVKQLEETVSDNSSRFTVIRKDGSVAADTGMVDTSSMDNHLDREEIKEALESGSGSSRRYSDTLKKNMLYVACVSDHSDYILRMAVPFTGFKEYLVLLLPAIWLSFLVAIMYSACSADSFAASVTKPLKEISQEMLKVNGDYTELTFETYQYPEINIIAETTTEMSKNVKEYLNQIELERQIRQEFFSNASHELKTPITSVQGYAELLESGIIQDEDQKMDFVRRIKKEAVHMTSLINDILMISRLETKEAEVVCQDVRMAIVLDDVLESLKPLAAFHEVLVHAECKPLCIYANARQMTELLGNLLSNAIKYNKPFGEVEVNVAMIKDHPVLTVEDDGIGIPPEDQERIFERFYRVDKSHSRQIGGTGLGLSIVKHGAIYHKAKVELKSAPGEGTTVRITF